MHVDKEIVIVVIYVDGLIVPRDNVYSIGMIKNHLHSKFDMKDLGEPCYFLSIKLMRVDDGIWLVQR